MGPEPYCKKARCLEAPSRVSVQSSHSPVGLVILLYSPRCGRCNFYTEVHIEVETISSLQMHDSSVLPDFLARQLGRRIA